ncbi:hypothetical protein ACHMW7_29710 [Aminobacter sp. UC22_36]|uniref:hypothetical protein n=1 Tax=Aminobacter sp. UC22_36 TaxID=3374549 RepID=UPI003756A1EB
MSIEEFNRLIRLGLCYTTAEDVLKGKLDETFEVDQAQERKKVHTWCRGRKNIPVALEALWDLEPSRFYLVFDGDDPKDHNPDDFSVIQAELLDVHPKLTYISGRDKDPWHRQYKSSSCNTAYRWVNGRPVTPPLICDYGAQIHIEGGMHRYHLAHHYGAKEMPFLVREEKLPNVLALLPSAKVLK